jgi:hypothetical protein
MRIQMGTKPTSSPGHDRTAREQRLDFCSSAAFLAAAGALVALLAGCTSPPIQATDRLAGFGDSFNQNAAVMIIDPQPPGARETALPLDGHRAEIAIIRYYTDTVIQPQALTTSGIGSVAGGAAPGVAAAATTGAIQ